MDLSNNVCLGLKPIGAESALDSKVTAFSGYYKSSATNCTAF